MNLKNFISSSIFMIIMLITFVIYISISKIVTNYEKSINNDYSIVLVTQTPLIESKIEDIKSIDLKNIVHLKRDKILDDLKNDLSTGSFKLLQKKLPYFYTIHLKTFPTTSKLKQIKIDLLKLSGIKSVETFSKDHDNIYSLFLLIRTITSILFLSILIFTFLLMTNQIKLWFYEHKERLDIIKFHGGSILYGAKPVIKTAILSSLFSSIFIVGFVFVIKNNLNLFFTNEMLNIINLYLTKYNTIEIASIFLISLFISFITIFGVLIKHKIN